MKKKKSKKSNELKVGLKKLKVKPKKTLKLKKEEQLKKLKVRSKKILKLI